MKKRTIKKRLMGFDSLNLPEKEKMLPEAALADNKKRKAVPRFALAALAAVLLVVLTVTVIGGVVSSAPENTGSSDAPAVLENESAPNKSEAEQSRLTLPIVYGGKYDPTKNTAESINTESGDDRWYVHPETVKVGTMGKTYLDGYFTTVDTLQDEVLYAVCFEAHPHGSEEYKEGMERLHEEWWNKVVERENTLIAFIEKYAVDREHFFFEYYAGYDYHEICELIYKQNFPEHWPGQDAPEFDDMVTLFGSSMKIFDEWQAKRKELHDLMTEAATAKMYEYLESEGIKFYDKTVYSYDGEKDNVVCEHVFRVAFLTKAEIAALKGGEDYGIAVMIAYEELATQDTLPVYIEAYGEVITND